MQHSHRLTNRGLRIRRLIAMLVLLLVLVAANTLQAQNSAYSFASGIGSTGADFGTAIDANDNLYVLC